MLGCFFPMALFENCLFIIYSFFVKIRLYAKFRQKLANKKEDVGLKSLHYTQKSGFGTSSLVLYVICVLGAKLGVLINKNYHNKSCFLLRSNNSICFAKSFSLKSSALCKSKSIFLISSTFCGAPVFLSKIIS